MRRLSPPAAVTALTVVAALLGAACASEPNPTRSSVGESGLCGLRAQLDGSWYVSTGGVRVIPAYGDALGMATVPPCGEEGGFSFEAFSIVGVRPEVAFESPRYEDLVFIAEAIQTAPEWLQQLRVEPTCAQQDEPITSKGHGWAFWGLTTRLKWTSCPPTRFRCESMTPPPADMSEPFSPCGLPMRLAIS